MVYGLYITHGLGVMYIYIGNRALHRGIGVITGVFYTMSWGLGHGLESFMPWFRG